MPRISINVGSLSLQANIFGNYFTWAIGNLFFGAKVIEIKFFLVTLKILDALASLPSKIFHPPALSPTLSPWLRESELYRPGSSTHAWSNQS